MRYSFPTAPRRTFATFEEFCAAEGVFPWASGYRYTGVARVRRSKISE